MGGRIGGFAHTPGRKLFAFLDAASEFNEHNAILIEGEDSARCVVRQIVGPVARRVVCRLRPGDRVPPGGRVGIMKFGSRLDVYLPAEEYVARVVKGDKVIAGRTVIAVRRGG
jgi:phosphatidylserine decarboxylase